MDTDPSGNPSTTPTVGLATSVAGPSSIPIDIPGSATHQESELPAMNYTNTFDDGVWANSSTSLGYSEEIPQQTFDMGQAGPSSMGHMGSSPLNDRAAGTASVSLLFSQTNCPILITV